METSSNLERAHLHLPRTRFESDSRRAIVPLVEAFPAAQIPMRSKQLNGDVLVWEHRASPGAYVVPALSDVTVSLLVDHTIVKARFKDGRELKRLVEPGELTLVSGNDPFDVSFQSKARMPNVSVSHRMLRLT